MMDMEMFFIVIGIATVGMVLAIFIVSES